MKVGGNDIHEYQNGKFRVRVFRKRTRYYLGMYPTYDAAVAAREQFLAKTDNGALLDEPEPEMYSKRWFELQAEKQKIDFMTRYAK